MIKSFKQMHYTFSMFGGMRIYTVIYITDDRIQVPFDDLTESIKDIVMRNYRKAQKTFRHNKNAYVNTSIFILRNEYVKLLEKLKHKRSGKQLVGMN